MKNKYFKYLRNLFYLFISVFFGFLLFLSFAAFRFHKMNGYINKMNRKIASRFKKYLGITELPKRLKNLNYINKGLVLSKKTIAIDGIDYPYNASIVQGDAEGSYYLFFRYDIPKERPLEDVHFPFESYIGVVPLDQNFKPSSFYKTINTHSPYSEDPRAFRINNELYVTYNDVSPSNRYSRTIHLAKLDKDLKTEYITNYDQHISPIEKNWVPFVYKKNTLEIPHFVYQINPHKILQILDTKSSQLNHLVFPDNPPYIDNLWEKWGRFSGGTPAQLVDGQYLSFFHSFFYLRKTKTFWYVMGAYTFEPQPPFRITAISKVPIIFKDIYKSESNPILSKKLRCLFPAGFVMENKQGKDVIHVSCGENDSAVKIITIDKEKLFESMRKIATEKNR